MYLLPLFLFFVFVAPKIVTTEGIRRGQRREEKREKKTRNRSPVPAAALDPGGDDEVLTAA